MLYHIIKAGFASGKDFLVHIHIPSIHIPSLSLSEDSLLHLSDRSLAVLVGLLVFVVFYTYGLYVTWKSQFGHARLNRTNEESPSYGNPPHPIPYETERNMVATRAESLDHAEISDYKTDADLTDDLSEGLSDGFDDDLSDDLSASKSVRNITPDLRSQLKKQASRTVSFTPRESRYGSININGTTFGSSMNRNSIMRQGQHHSERLDMDHQYIPFLSYAWGVIFIGHNAAFLWVTGVITLKIRHVLHKWGWIEPKLFDPSLLAAKLILEMSLAVHYVGKRKEGDKEIGGFFFPDFPIVKPDGSFAVAELLSVELDLTNKRMIWAKLDDRDLTADEAVILLFYYIISANHVKLHSLANWAINMEPEQVKKNPFPAQNSLVTTIYNYFGYTVFTTFFSGWKSMGVLSKDWDHQSLLDTFDLGIDNNIFMHPHVKEIAQHSNFVDFHVKLRPYFLKEFGKMKRKYFPGCHGEALFVGTIMHSLDHCHMDWAIEDPLWLDISHPEFGKMAEMGRVVKVGFVKDLPGLLFHKRYKGSKHPFYEKIYNKATTINIKLADCMDTCIIK